ncbi:MAG: cupin domain-containing protein [Lachnospirales bacterium]
MVRNYWFGDDLELIDLGEGVKRKVMAYSDNIMVVEVHFEKGSVGSMHNHPHEQATYVLKGSFEFTIGGETKIVKEGDCLYKEPDIVHGAKALEEGVLLDVFTPMRKDFL